MQNEPQALVVIDVQQGFISDDTKQCLPYIHELIHQKKFDVVIATRFYNPENSPFRRFIRWERLSTPEEIALDEVVEKKSDFIIDKSTYGAGDKIANILVEKNINKVTLVGIDTDVCVLHNAAYLFDHGFEVTVDTKGCATNGGEEAQKAAYLLLRRTLGRDFVL